MNLDEIKTHSLMLNDLPKSVIKQSEKNKETLSKVGI